MSDSLALATAAYRRGNFAEAYALAMNADVRSQVALDEKDCLVCDCLQYRGDFNDAERRANGALSKELRPELVARYWEILGRIRLDQLRYSEAAEALGKGLRVAEKGSDLLTLASLQQLWLVASGPTLEAGLSSAVREAYHTAVRSADATAVAGFHVRLARLEGQRGAFTQALHHLTLAKSLLDRAPHTALLALYHVNLACVLALTGAFGAARKNGEVGAALAQQAGHLRLAMAGAATISYIAISAGDTSVAESWLKTACKAAKALGTTEVSLLHSLACAALVQGDFELASERLSEARKRSESIDFRWSNGTEALYLLTELYLHKRLGHKLERAALLTRTRQVSDQLGDQHLELLVILAEAEAHFDGARYLEARDKVAEGLRRSPGHLVYRAELDRMAARSLWIDGRCQSAKRRLLRACSIAQGRGTRMGWAEALREVRSLGQHDRYDEAYSLEQQTRQAKTKFTALTNEQRETWFEQNPSPEAKARDPLDGFDDAVSVLLATGDPELRGREALASVLALGISDRAAITSRGTSGLQVVSSVGLPKSVLSAPESKLTRIEIGSSDNKTIELVLEPRKDLRSLFAVSGIRRLLEAATALEAQKKDQQRLGALWQPENIVEEPGAIFSSPVMIDLMLTARKVAATRLPVLLLGPTGTGKEVLAKAIHRASPRANQVLLAFNCSAVPRDMVESQLFGYRRGAFTGATDDFLGIIRSAEGGTLFLDEIGELSIDLQPKLLRFLETSEVHPLGEGRPVKVDVRVIAATNANLDDLIERKEFREDLYYRLNIVRFHMPQLRERREEIPPLVTHLIRQFQLEENKHGIKVSDELIEYLLLYPWPGNIRQLANEVRRMVAMVSSNETLVADHLTPSIRATRRTVPVVEDAETPEPPKPEPSPAGSMTLALEQSLPEAVEALERAMIEHAIARAHGKVEEAARLLGISRKGLFLKRRRWLGGDTPSTDV